MRAGRHRLAQAVVMLAAGALLVACRSGTLPETPTPASIATLEPLSPEALVWALSAAPVSLDAANTATDPAAQQIAAQVYDRLVRFRPGSVQLAPGLAANWEVDPAGTRYTFTIREGLQFHDGTPLDAAAVAWNFQRWMDPEHPAHHGEFKAWRDLFGGFVGEENDQGRPRNLIETVEVVDARTVRVTLQQPFTPFLHHLALLAFGMASPTAVGALGAAYGADGNHLPVGSGPFAATAWLPDGTVRLRRFDGYWGQAAQAPEIQFTVISDPELRAAAVVSGQVHGAELPATMPITGTLAASNIDVVARPPRANSWLVLNHHREPFGDVRVRQAIDLAIDRQQLARDHFGPLSIPANQLLPPGFPGHVATLPEPRYDPEAAKELMAEAGVTDGFDLNIWVASTPRVYLPDPMGTATDIAKMLEPLGIRASARSATMRRFLAERERGRYTAWLLGWEAQSGDPDNWWYWHFGPGRQAAEGQYDKPDLARLLLDAQRMPSTGQRTERYEEAARMAAADTPRIYLTYTSPIVAVSKRLRRYVPSPMDYDDFSQVSLPPPVEDATAVPVPTGDVPTPTPGPPGTPDAAATDGTPAAGDPAAEAPGEPGTPGTPGTPAAATAPAGAATVAGSP